MILSFARVGRRSCFLELLGQLSGLLQNSWSGRDSGVVAPLGVLVVSSLRFASRLLLFDRFLLRHSFFLFCDAAVLRGLWYDAQIPGIARDSKSHLAGRSNAGIRTCVYFAWLVVSVFS